MELLEGGAESWEVRASSRRLGAVVMMGTHERDAQMVGVTSSERNSEVRGGDH